MWGAPISIDTLLDSFCGGRSFLRRHGALVSTQIIRGGVLSEQNTYETTLETGVS